MDASRKRGWTLIAAAAIAGFCCIASPCRGEAKATRGGGTTFGTFGLALFPFELGPLVGFEHRWPAGPGVEAAVGINVLTLIAGASTGQWGAMITGETLGVFPLLKIGRSGTLDLLAGIPAVLWTVVCGVDKPLIPLIVVGGAVRLRFSLNDRWSLFGRLGAGYGNILGLFVSAQELGYSGGVMPDIQIGTALRT